MPYKLICVLALLVVGMPAYSLNNKEQTCFVLGGYGEPQMISLNTTGIDVLRKSGHSALVQKRDFEMPVFKLLKIETQGNTCTKKTSKNSNLPD